MHAVEKPLVAIVMGSKSDWELMKHADETLAKFGVAHECRVLSAHRTPDQLREYMADAEKRGVEVWIAAAGGAAHLAGVVAAHTMRPVLGCRYPARPSTASIRCWPSCRCRPAYLSERWRSASQGSSTRRYWP